MSSSIDHRDLEFMRLEALLKAASSEVCWHRAMREVQLSLKAKKIDEADAKILRDNYPKSIETLQALEDEAPDIYFFKKPEFRFTQYIDQLVTGFNAVARAENQPTDVKTFLLKKIFNRLTDLAIMEITNAVHNTDYIEQAISRTYHVLDIMMDDANDYAPELVRNDTLDNALYDESHEWHALAVHRGENADHLRKLLEAFYETESVLREQKTQAQSPSSRSSGKIFVPQLSDALERRPVPSPNA